MTQEQEERANIPWAVHQGGKGLWSRGAGAAPAYGFAVTMLQIQHFLLSSTVPEKSTGWRERGEVKPPKGSSRNRIHLGQLTQDWTTD